MSTATVATIINRIETATPESPIAVYRSAAYGKLEAHFASTVQAQNQINQGVGLIGVFNNSMDLSKVKSTLRAALI